MNRDDRLRDHPMMQYLVIGLLALVACVVGLGVLLSAGVTFRW